MLAVGEPAHDLARGLLARELAEIFFDVLDFERTRVERVLLDQVFQRVSVAYRILLRGGQVPEAMRTTNGLPVCRAPVVSRTARKPAPCRSPSSSPGANPARRSPNRAWTHVWSCSFRSRISTRAPGRNILDVSASARSGSVA